MSDLNQENKAIKFPKSHYIGIIGRDSDALTLAFMTEDGTDKAAEKRKSTVDGWVAQNSRGSKAISTARTYENKPMIGFRLTRSIRRDSSWGAGNVKWRIEDPRGFELEISSPNMARIIDTCVIDRGDILEECIWARLKGDNVLVPISSDLYVAAQRNDERTATRVKPSACERGDHVVLQNGSEGIYLGKFESLDHCYTYDGDRPLFQMAWKKKPVHAILMEQQGHDGKSFKHIHAISTLKPSYLTKREGGPLPPEEAEAMVWKLNNGRAYVSNRLYLEKTEVVYTETPMTLAEYMKRQDKGYLAVNKGGVLYKVDVESWSYDRWKSGQASTGYGSRDGARLTSLTKNADGSYTINDRNSNHFYHGRGYDSSFDEISAMATFVITATCQTSDGAKRNLR